MTVLLGLLTQAWPLLVLIGVAAVSFLKGRSSGVKGEQAKQAKREAKAIEERHEMDREATEAERRAAEMTDQAAREEALKWRKS